jgi:sporulation protein YlmC with PRC-barrel domain
MAEVERPSHAYIQGSRVTGTAVYGADGERLGTIEDIVLTKVEGQAVYAVLSFGGFLGMGDRHHPIPWSLLRYDEGLGGYIVNLSREELGRAPGYARDAEPDWSDPMWGDPVWGTRTREDDRPPVMDPVEGERRF